MAVEVLEKREKPATVEDVLREVSRMKTVVTDAVDDGVRSALRTIRENRNAAEDALDDALYDAKRAVKRSPFQAVGLFFAAGVVTGCVMTCLGFRRR